MKWLLASISALFLSTAVVWLATASSLATTPDIIFYHADFQKQNLQLGYYDFLSQKKELYDPCFETRNETLFMTLTSPEDNRFVAKGKLIQLGHTRQDITFDYQPIFTSSPNSRALLDSVINYMANNAVSVTPMVSDGQELLITHNGLILASD